jgi:excisionase family DNA binding protein
VRRQLTNLDDAATVDEQGFATVMEAAEFLGLSRAKLYLIMDSGQLAYAKFGKSRRIPRRGLRAYAEKCMVVPN